MNNDKSIWKKALGLFVEFEGEETPVVSDPNDMNAVMAETREALSRIDNPPPASSQQPLSSVVPNYIPQEEVEEVLESQSQSGDQGVNFQALYDKVSKSQNSISIFKVEEILQQPELQSLPRETRAKAAAVALRAMGSSIEEMVQDAYLKDQVLDQAELAHRQKVDAKKQANDQQIKTIQKEVDDYLKAKNAEIEALRDTNLQAELQLQTWVEAKLKEERRIFEILGHFVEDDAANITLGENHPDNLG